VTAGDPSDAPIGKRVAIVQSCYIPWKGYFDLINRVDEFLLFDDRQFTRRDWRNRNRIKLPHGVQWLTIPVATKGRYTQRIDETVVSDRGWAATHWRTLAHAYRGAPCFGEVGPQVEDAYAGVASESRLSAINRRLVELVCDLLGIGTRLAWSTDYEGTGVRTERLVSLARAAGGSTYVSGPTARAYLDEGAFADAGITVEYVDYEGYPEYPQLHGPFDHHVTVLDLLFNTGRDAPRYLKTLAGRAAA